MKLLGRVLALAASAVVSGGCEVAIEFRSRADSSTDTMAAVDDGAIEASADSAVDADATSVDAIDVAVIDVVPVEDAVSDVVSDVVSERAFVCSTDSDCGAGRMCTGGMCVVRCVPAIEQCNGVDDDCDGAIDEDDPMTPVCPAGQSCRSAMCMPTGACPAGLTSCGGACVNLATDARNCGSCGSACAAGQRCAAGVCTL